MILKFDETVSECFVAIVNHSSNSFKLHCQRVSYEVAGLHTLMAKAIGIVFSVSAGLPCGKAGRRRILSLVYNSPELVLETAAVVQSFVYLLGCDVARRCCSFSIPRKSCRLYLQTFLLT